jgi:hypothetical protein
LIRRLLARRGRGGTPRKLGVMLTYEDEDIVLDTIGHLLESGHEVIAWDNGSRDGTWERLTSIRRELRELRRVPRDEVGLYEIYGAMSIELMNGVAAGYDWISWPDSDEILLSDDPGEPYGTFVDRLIASQYDWCQFRNWNFWWTTDDDPAVASPVARIRHYALFEHCAPRVRAWRAGRTNMREFNHNPVPGERYPELANLCHYPMRSREQARERLRTRSGIRRGEQNWHYDRLQREPQLLEIRASDLNRLEQDPRRPGLRLEQRKHFDWLTVYGA